MGRTAMSRRELGRVEVLSRVRSKQLRVVDAGVLLQLSYRQTKRLWKRYREEGAAGLKHRSAGRRSNRAYGERFRGKVLGLVRKKYSGEVGERFGGCWPRDCGVGSGGDGDTGEDASARSTWASWCRWTGAFTLGWRSAVRQGV